MKDPFISKSKYLAGLQCHRLLWHYYNAKEKIPAVDASTQAIFDQGHQVGELAKTLYPDGIEITGEIKDFDRLASATLEALKHRKPLFEATFKYKNAYARADILNPVSKSGWDVIEVKSSTEAKEINFHDLAFQRYTYEGCGVPIRKTLLMHINKEYVRRGEIKPEELFALEDVTNEVKKLLPTIEPNLDAMAKVIQSKHCPLDDIGPHCDDPYGCPLQETCWDFLPEHSVFTLSRLGQKAYALMAEGIYDLLDLPDDYRLTNGQGIQLEAIRSGEPHIDKKAIAKFLKQLKYPLHYLDFETFRTAIPMFDNSKPYQQIPFQFSLHIVKSPGASPEHHAFLAEGRDDPRKGFLDNLKSVLGTRGSIVAYNASFEATVLRDLAAAHPSYSKWVASVKERIVDLLVPFRTFAYYHPDQKGSASIKVVLPVLTGSGYEDLPIADGDTASLEYLRVTHGDTTETERTKVRKQLEQYCGLDTLGMLKILLELERSASGD